MGMDLKQLIFDLCAQGGVSGSEEPALEAAAKALSGSARTQTDRNNNLYAFCGNENGKKTILLDAHIDRIGLIVTDIDERGFVKVDKCGGTDVRILQNTRLTAQNSGITGVVCCLPPHLSDGSEGKATPINKVWVDFGMSRAEVSKHIGIGDVLTFAAKPASLLNGKITAPALDNRCSVAALIRTAELIRGKQTDYKVVMLFSSQEETYGTGAATGAFSIQPDEAVAVDVSFASQPDVSGQYGKIELGKGPMIGISPILNKKMTEKLLDICTKEQIPYQVEPIGGRTGTNADKIAVTACGVKTAMVSIPQRYMHTPVEVISVSDVENTARLLAEYILSGGAYNDRL